MLKKEIIINSENGLHIRPAAILVKTCKKFKSEIFIEYKKKKVNAKSLFKVQTLGVIQGDKILLLIEGKDELEALEQIIKIIKNLK
ncbi:HPr family phosphocarrier protein [Enterobacterales bacterium endosymbiont of Anomoneura mori]|uniref:HPr family phosphocarrier protein n=1 Tax=Enterobacterales bacterium endosymbiont of Anomoneura mori TaxID=3132096 RepID=UPI00399CAD86